MIRSIASEELRFKIIEVIKNYLEKYDKNKQEVILEIIDRSLVSGELASILLMENIANKLKDDPIQMISIMNHNSKLDKIPENLKDDYIKFRALEFVTITLSAMLPDEIKEKISKTSFL